MLTHVKIRNFGCCADTDVLLGTPVVGLVGRYGAGKTTILQAIEWLALSGTASESKRPGASLDAPRRVAASFDICGHQYSFSAVGRYLKSKGTGFDVVQGEERLTKESEDSPKLVFYRRGEEVHTPLRDEPILIGAEAPSLGALASLLPSPDPLLQVIAPVRDYLGRIRYYTLAEPEGQSDIIKLSDYQEWARSFEAGDSAADFVAYRILYMHEQDNESFRELCDLVGPSGLGLIDGIDIVFYPQGDVEKRQFCMPWFRPGANLGGHGMSVPYSALSAGTKRILRLLVHLLFDRGSVMLLEQPEDCVHPGLLYKLLDILRAYSDQCQVIFSTHSLEVLSTLRPEEVRLVEARNGSTSCRGLSRQELQAAAQFLASDGSLGEFVESLDAG